jgi:hypothetical protein
MRPRHYIILGLFALALSLSFPVQLSAESMGVSHGYDLDELWARAQKNLDLKAHDAVLLLESRRVSILENGNLRTRVHRVVWIGTEAGIDHHADLRIPWNSAASTFTVVALRTWNDDRWWPDESKVSETAVVETLPFALALADDYTSMRETMLLHDGVELPCIMETIYEIEEEGAAKDGADDLFVFPQDDPALLVEYGLTVPVGVTPAFRTGNGAPEQEIISDADQSKSYIWRMDNIGRLGTPHTETPVVYEPYLLWSTWKDWETLGKKIRSSFNEVAVLSEMLVDSLAERMKYEPSEEARARAIVDIVSEWTRSIDYDWGFWRFSPRPATRTYETGYGHVLDRAVLAAALFGEAGFDARLTYRTAPLTRLDQDVPGLSPFEGCAVRVQGYDVDRVYDPQAGTCEHIYSWMHGVTIWEPGGETDLIEQSVDEPVKSCTDGECTMILELEPTADGTWKGTGYLRSRFGLSHYDDMAGIDNRALGFIEEILQAILPGAHIAGYNPERFLPDDVAVGFDFEMETPEPDSQGRISLAVGEPAGGIMSRLPRDLHLYDEHRDSPVFGGKMAQRIKLRMKIGDREIIYIPESYEFENEEGRFILNVGREGEWITIEWGLSLERDVVQPEAWLLLRALLLEEQDPTHRTIILK